MICVHVVSVTLIHALSVALLMFVTPYFQIITPSARSHQMHTEAEQAQEAVQQEAHTSGGEHLLPEHIFGMKGKAVASHLAEAGRRRCCCSSGRRSPGTRGP